MITAYAILKKAAAIANHNGKRLDDQRCKLIVQTCDEILAGQHHDMFPLHVWMTGSGTQFNMNVNEVVDPTKMVKPYVANRADRRVPAA
jgi:fumarate hydratase class II